MGHYDDCREAEGQIPNEKVFSTLGGGRTQRATPPVSDVEVPLMAQAIGRVQGARFGLQDYGGSLMAMNDALLGTSPNSSQETASAPTPPVGGAMAELFSQISMLEEAVEAIGREVRRQRLTA